MCRTSSSTARSGSKSLSRTKDGGTKLYGASGKVKRPGLWELPMGTTIREILEEHAGGMRDGVRFRGLLPGGASTDFLTERASRRADGFHRGAEGRQPHGHRHHDRARRPDLSRGHGLEPGTLLRAGILRLVHARAGAAWHGWSAFSQAIEEGRGQPGDLEKLAMQTRFWAPGHTFCALAPGAAEPLQSALEIFPRRFRAAHHRDSAAPGDSRWRQCTGSTTAHTRWTPAQNLLARLPVARLRPAVLLLAPGDGLGGRLPAVRGQAVQGRERHARARS